MKVRELLDKIDTMMKVGDLDPDSEIVFAVYTSFGAVESDLGCVTSRPGVELFSGKRRTRRELYLSNAE